MKKNTLLNIASFTCKLINGVILITLILLTVFFIHFQIDKSAYKKWDFVDQKSRSGVIFSSGTKYSLNSQTVGSQKPNIQNISTASLYFNYLKFVVISLLLFISLSLFEKVIVSVRNLKTFEKINVYAFKRIGVYCLIIGVISSFDYWVFETQFVSSKFSLNITFFIISLMAFVLGEIFKEGNQLKLENDLTV